MNELFDLAQQENRDVEVVAEPLIKFLEEITNVLRYTIILSITFL